MLSSNKVAYSDGAEERIVEILLSAQDLSSMSNELEDAAEGWAQRYHLAKSRANVLRAVDLPSESRVLEIGAGCGAVTRYLGETCAVVDAVEPVETRAAASALRTRDLPGVAVFAGSIEDVPELPAYDLVVLIGVLEYVAGGRADVDEYVGFLESVKRRLSPGGKVVCAIENQIGVKYLCGAPEDHSNRAFDGIEGYPSGGPARMFSRESLTAMFADIGFGVEFLHAFPDYKLSRLVYSDALVGDPEIRDLAWRIPDMPSPDWLDERPRGASERALWRTLVRSGLGNQFANSFVLAAGADDDRICLWPDHRRATFFTTTRRAEFATRTDVTAGGPSDRTICFERRLVCSTSSSAEVDRVHIEVSDSTFVPGQDLVDVLVESDRTAIEAAVKVWAGLAREAERENDMLNVDMVPHNILVGDDGKWHMIDQEWFAATSTKDFLLMRGVFWLGIKLAHAVPADRWDEEWLVLDLVLWLSEAAGLDPDGSWIDTMLDEEAVLQATAKGATRGQPDYETRVADSRTQLTKALAHPLSHGQLGLREHDLRRALEHQLTVHREHLTRAGEMLRGLNERCDELQRRADESTEALHRMQDMLANSRGWKFVTTADRFRRFLVKSPKASDGESV